MTRSSGHHNKRHASVKGREFGSHLGGALSKEKDTTMYKKGEKKSENNEEEDE